MDGTIPSSALSKQQTRKETHAASLYPLFEEHLVVIEALKESYEDGQEDAQGIQALHDVYEHIKDLVKQREHDTRELIQAMTRKVDEVAERARYPKAVDQHARELEQIAQGRGEMEKEVQSLESQMEALENQREEVKKSIEGLEMRWKELKVMETVEEPLTRHLLSLFAHVSKITWDLKRIDRIAGTIDNPNCGVFEDFDLGDGEDVSYDTVNVLWDTIAGEAMR